MKKQIKEQESKLSTSKVGDKLTLTDDQKLLKAKYFGCFSSQIKWENGGQPQDYEGKRVLIGKNPKGESIVFFSDLTAINTTTKKTAQGSCPQIESSLNKDLDQTTLSVDQMQYIQDMKKYSAVQTEKPSDFLTTNLKKFQKIDLNLLDPDLFPEKNKFFVYSQISLANIKRNQYEEVEKLLEKAGYTLTEPSATTPEFQMGRDVETILKGLSNGFLTNMFKGKGIMAYPTSLKPQKGAGKDLVSSTKTEIEQMKVNRGDCQSVIKFLYKNSKKGVTLIPNQANHLKMQDLAYRCATQGMNFLSGIGGIQDEITYLKNDSGPYGLNKFFRKSMKEQDEKNLSNLVKTNLMEISQNKKKMINEEKKIVSTRFTLLSENINIKTKNGKDKFYNDLLSEILYLNRQGFDKQVIEEGFFETINGIFGKSSEESVLKTFKQYIINWLIKNLTSINNKNWVSNIITKSIGDVDLSLTPKLISDCNFLTNTISKPIVEESVNKIKTNPDSDGEIYSILKTSIVQSLEENNFGAKVETSISAFICPLLNGVKQKMDVTSNTMKEKAMS
jgi:hypothetical protein